MVMLSEGRAPAEDKTSSLLSSSLITPFTSSAFAANLEAAFEEAVKEMRSNASWRAASRRQRASVAWSCAFRGAIGSASSVDADGLLEISPAIGDRSEEQRRVGEYNKKGGMSPRPCHFVGLA